MSIFSTVTTAQIKAVPDRHAGLLCYKAKSQLTYDQLHHKAALATANRRINGYSHKNAINIYLN